MSEPSNKQNSQLSEEEYFIKLDNISLASEHHLRNAFKARWKAETGEDWIDNLENVHKFLNGIGQKAYKIAQKSQRIVLNSKCIEEWDTPLLSVTIQNFGDEEKYKNVNLAVWDLKKLRNFCKHHTTHKIKDDEYQKEVEIVQNSLKSIGVEENVINKLIERAGITSSVKALEHMKSLHEKADKLLKDGHIKNAGELYSEAVNLPSLLPTHLGIAYEKRAEYFLKFVNDPVIDEDKINLALKDSLNALELNDYSWSAHYLCAQCFRWKNDHIQSVPHYERCHMVSGFIHQLMANDLEACKIISGIHERNSSCNRIHPVIMDMNLQEQINIFEKETGQKLTEEEYLNYQLNVERNIAEGQEDVFRGHQYFCGWNCTQNFEKAVKFYEKAAEIKNAEGMYYLALCYYLGNGVNQDLKEAVRILWVVATEMDEKYPGRQTLLKNCNLGVALSQHALGLLFENGTGVDQCFEFAAYWYDQAMENGVGEAACNLGLFYANGIGLEKDLKYAEMCWKQGLELNDRNVTSLLMQYYVNEMEPEKAEIMVKIGRKMGNNGLLTLKDEEMERILKNVISRRQAVEPEVVKFENKNRLEVKGFTFRERIDRKNKIFDPSGATLISIFEQSINAYSVNNSNFKRNDEELIAEVISKIEEKARNGSELAVKILNIFGKFYKLKLLLEINNNEEYSEDEKLEILNLLYDCSTNPFEVGLVHFPVEIVAKLKKIIAKLFLRYRKSEDSEERMKVLFCFAEFNLYGVQLSDNMFKINLLTEGVERYSGNENFYERLAISLRSKGKVGDAVICTENGLKICPNHPGLLYLRAVNRSYFMIGGKSFHEIVPGFEDFLKVVPTDHYMVPSALFNISFLYLREYNRLYPNEKCKNELNLLKIYFERGLEAQSEQLTRFAQNVRIFQQLNTKIMDFIRKIEKTTENRKTPEKTENNYKNDFNHLNLGETMYLRSPARKAAILAHRKIIQHFEEPKFRDLNDSIISNLKQIRPKKLSMMKSITLMEIYPKKDRIFENRYLELTVIDDPLKHGNTVYLVAEDENGDVTRLYIYNVNSFVEIWEIFGAGSRLAVMNPVMRIGVLTTDSGIVCEDWKCIMCLEKVENMCRFCGEENSLHKCARCERPYCSKWCEEADRSELSHSGICSLSIL